MKKVILLIVFFICITSETTLSQGFKSNQCVGELIPPPTGVSEEIDNNLLNLAQKVEWKGGICNGAVFRTTDQLEVYRVYDKTHRYTKSGSWWIFTNPNDMTEERFRTSYAVCRIWGGGHTSYLNSLRKCKIEIGSKIVIGTTQSVRCGKDKSYQQTKAIQIFIPTETTDKLIDCTDLGKWPNK